MAASYSAVSAATANLTLVRAGPTTLTGWLIINTSASARYVRIYNKSSAPVPASDAALISIRLPLPAGDGSNVSLPGSSIWFSAGLAFDITGAPADTDATAVVAGDVTINLFYQ